MPKPDDRPSSSPMSAAELTALWRQLQRLRAEPETRRAGLFRDLGLTPEAHRLVSDLIDHLADVRVLEPGVFIDGEGCGLGWQPSVLAPVFYGFADFSVGDGLPRRVRVFYPSTEGSPENAPIVQGCGRYPLIALLHGQCGESDHFLRWDLVPRQLARSGYVVVVPELRSRPPFTDDNPDVSDVEQILLWMRTAWPHAAVLMPRPMTGVAGHSWGALAGAMVVARLQAQGAVSAYASLSGGWLEWPSVPPRPLAQLDLATLFVYGTGSSDLFANLEGAATSIFNEPRGATHKVVIRGGEHWDYFRDGDTSCGLFRGPCTLTRSVAADFVTSFFSHYVPPQNWTLLGSTIPHNLIPPPLNLTPQQQFFAGGHLQGFAALAQTTCSLTHTWRLPPLGGGSISFGPP